MALRRSSGVAIRATAQDAELIARKSIVERDRQYVIIKSKADV
jgi:hypothetical protein